MEIKCLQKNVSPPLIQEVLPADSGVHPPLPRAPSILPLPVRVPTLSEAGPDECLQLRAQLASYV